MSVFVNSLVFFLFKIINGLANSHYEPSHPDLHCLHIFVPVYRAEKVNKYYVCLLL